MSGPVFTAVESVDYDPAGPGPASFVGRTQPLVVRGAAAALAPELSSTWSLSSLAARADKVSQHKAAVQNGLLEQGEEASLHPHVDVDLPAYLRNLVASSSVQRQSVASEAAARALSSGGTAELDFAPIAHTSAAAAELYLGHWDVCATLPGASAQLEPLRKLWPRGHFVFALGWVGVRPTFRCRRQHATATPVPCPLTRCAARRHSDRPALGLAGQLAGAAAR